MKNSTFLRFFKAFFIACLLVSTVAYTQVNEKFITTISNTNGTNDIYSFKYDIKSGSWVYNSYDTITRMSTLITPKGSSAAYNYITQYFTLFDTEGNAYTIVSEIATDTSSNYYILKNTERITPAYQFISEGWAMRDGIIYFSGTVENKSYFNSYNTKTGELLKSRPYDEVRLVYIPSGYTEGEPMGEVGFTKSGKPYYVALENNETFLVIGGEDQKHYADIGYYEVKFDDNDVPYYIAKSDGRMYETRGNTFVVHGTREFKKFDWIYGPLMTDKNNNVVYVGQDSTGDYMYRSTLMRGGDAVKTYDGSVYSYSFAPNGKLAYVVSENSSEASGTSSGSYLVFDGKNGKKYGSIGLIKFTGSSVPLYSATDKKGKTVIVMDDETVSPRYDYFPDFGYLADGSMFWIGTNYGNYEAKKPDKNYVMIHGEKYGPYDFVYTSDWKTNAMVLSGKNGNFAFVAGRNTDYDNYIYKYNVVTGDWKSADYDAITDLKLSGEKVFYFGGMQSPRGQYMYDYTLYINNKAAGTPYGSVTEVNADGGKLTFLGARNNNMYYVEVK